MNKLQMRQTLETVLGYYLYTKNADHEWVRSENPECPGYYYFNGEPFRPAFYMEGQMRVPTSWDAKGLETTLMEVPKIRVLDLPGGIQERWQTWTVWMRQWDNTKTIEEYERAVLRCFGGQASSSSFIENDKVMPDRCKITITTKSWDLATYVEGSQVMNPPSPIEQSPEKTYFDQ
jgi:hypothetical protein